MLSERRQKQVCDNGWKTGGARRAGREGKREGVRMKKKGWKGGREEIR